MLSATRKTLISILIALILMRATVASDEKRLSIYSSVATYTLPVNDRLGREYVGLLEVLEPLGRISAHVEGQHWKMRFNSVDADFVSGRTHAKLRGRDLDLGGPFLIENSRGMVSLTALSSLLPLFLGNPVNFHESARRLFIGNVGIHVAFQLDPGNPSKLVLTFTATVNPTISTEPGTLKMIFSRDPLMPPVNSSPTFENSPITQALFTENDGHVDLTIAAEVPLMASFSNGGRTITVAAIPPGTPSAANDSLPGTPSSAVRLPAEPEPDKISSSGPPRGASAAPRVLAIVDAAHGGSERGAALSDTVAEKDVTLGFARLLRHELERQGFAVLLLRNGDDTLSLDQRAGSVNFAHPAIYISLHAASEGSGARVYTSLLPLEGSDRGPFRAWDAAQRVALPLSQAAASAIVSEMQKHDFRAHGYVASLRPLNNVLVPAVAIELAPGPNGVSDLPSANYQQKAAAAIADGVATLRDRLGSQP